MDCRTTLLYVGLVDIASGESLSQPTVFLCRCVTSLSVWSTVQWWSQWMGGGETGESGGSAASPVGRGYSTARGSATHLCECLQASMK